MRSLFLKIFIWCWLVNILVFGALAVFFIWAKDDSGKERFEHLFNRAIASYARDTINVWENNGRAGLERHLQELEKTTGIQLLVINEREEEVLGRLIPDHWQRTLDEDEGTPAVESGMYKRRHESLVRVTGQSGQQYCVVSMSPRRPRIPTELLITLAVAAAMVSFVLARYVTAPVRRLRDMTLRLAHGDLAARVGDPLGRRRDVIGDLGRDFDYMAERVESLISVQQRLLRDVSHELRSPLARLNIALGIAARDASPDAEKALERIELEAERLNDLIGQLLTVARLDVSCRSTEEVTIDLWELLHRIAADAGFEARSRNCQVRLSECQRSTVIGTPELLHSAIENVVRNGIKYTAEGTEVEISLAELPDGRRSNAVICIRDHGDGVPEEELDNIFRPFHRIADARERQTGGVGLGLAITERAIRLHGGTVTAANANDGGLIVEIRLPLVEAL